MSTLAYYLLGLKRSSVQMAKESGFRTVQDLHFCRAKVEAARLCYTRSRYFRKVAFDAG